MSEEVIRVPVYYRRDATGKLLYVNGAYGGVQPKGEIAVHFYADILSLPELVTLERKADGALSEVGVKRERSIEREIVATIVMIPPVAETIGRWLLQKAEDAIRRAGKVEELDSDEKAQA
jgi:hypothetical protein